MNNKIHKDADDQTPCGLPCWRNARRAIEWADVTCKNCLKHHTGEKVLDSINKELNALPWTTEQEEKTPFDKWNDWFRLCCDHSFCPTSYETWDGAIDTVCGYLKNELCSPLGYKETEEILDKTKKKFKNEY